MTTWFISRHPGAIEWVKQQNIQINRFESHLDTSLVQADDVVIGTLPIHLAAEVCQKGAKFYFLSINVAPEQRGTELTCKQLTEQQCLIQPFMVEKL
ncbi:CRISPR-associated protein Csx16 [Aggregatibacter kilianii]|uniref:CRISPR-associated protein Csx16 n=1 Tax=Aggregatibacter kilianii TaxID=2025884 RepID=UPI0028EFA0AB|nr:CRISPR-associated protein Csx16 [Aggregatibacter kilianii]